LKEKEFCSIVLSQYSSQSGDHISSAEYDSAAAAASAATLPVWSIPPPFPRQEKRLQENERRCTG